MEKGSDFVKYAEQMMKKNIRVNGEFYTCPVFNEDNKKIRKKECGGIGFPEKLQKIKNIFAD